MPSTELIAQLTTDLAALTEALPTDKDAMIVLYRQLVDAYREQNKFGKAAEQLENMLQIIADQPDTELQQAELYHELAWHYSRTLETERAIVCSQQAIELFSQKEAEDQYAKTYRRLGALYIENGDNDTGLAYLNTALEWGQKNDDQQITGDTYRTLAETHAYLNRYQEATNCYMNAISFYERIDNYKQIANCYQAIGRMLLQHGKHTQAIQQYKLAENALSQEDDAAEELALNHLTIAKIHETKSNTPDAIAQYQLAADCFGDSGNQYEQTNAYIQVAALYEETKNWDTALETYQTTLPYAETVGDEMQTATITEGIKHCQKMMAKQTAKPTQDNQQKNGIFSQLKKIFGK